MYLTKFIDTSFFKNPLYEYFKWFYVKCFYQIKYWGSHLRIDYKAKVNDTVFGRFNYVGWYSVVGDSVIGDFTYIADYCRIYYLFAGKFCSIGPGVRTAPGKHPVDYVSTHPTTYNNQPNLLKNFSSVNNYVNREAVTIGNDVWVGCNAIIMDGVTIGDGAVVAANSVVTKNVGNYEIVGGVPAKFIKKRFNEEEIELLMKCQWWNNSDEWIQENIDRFYSIKDFTDKMKTNN